MKMLRQKGLLTSVPMVLMLLTACGTTNKSNRSAAYPEPYWTMENRLASKSASEGASERSSKSSSQIASSNQTHDTAATSSLEALQTGRSTATPESSPLKDIHFDFDRYDLRADARERLKMSADWLKENPSVRVQIEGHCDERGTNEYNLGLGAKRAQAARDYLITLGIDKDRLSTISYGEEVPVCKEQTEACWEKNRRDRFVVLPVRPAS